MSSLKDLVSSVVKEFVRDGVLFTALDVSNKVKQDMPFARHREVRDLVREMFVTDIEPASYAKTPIEVVLTDGSSVEALLYHPLADSWDLDAKYDDQKRHQTTLNVTVNTQAAAIFAPKTPASSVLTGAVSNPPSTSIPVVPSFPANPSSAWDAMFASKPSLFPKR